MRKSPSGIYGATPIITSRTLLREKEISEDDERKAEQDVQNVTNLAIAKADEIVAEKEKELLEI